MRSKGVHAFAAACVALPLCTGALQAQTLRTESILPAATDQAIDQALGPHYVAYGLDVAHRGRLFVYLHGLGGVASGATELIKTAAELGFHAVGITYVNEVVPFASCGTVSSQCYEDLRREMLDGVDRSPFVDISPANSVVNRVRRLVEHLEQLHPGEGWGSFAPSGEPAWGSIVVWGHSQGGANAAMLARHVALAGVAMSGQATDFVNGQPASWWSTHLTLTQRMYGFCHTQDQLSAKLLVWDRQGLDDFGPVVDIALSPLPYQGTHQLSTSVPPAVSGQFHNSVVADAVTPRNPDGTPVYEPVWRFMLMGALDEGSPHARVCLGDGSQGACPCANTGAAGHGCANSVFATGAELTASGAARLSADTLVLGARNVSGSACLFYQGTQLVAPFAADDGRNCAGGSILRLATRAVSGGASSHPPAGAAGIGTTGGIPLAGGTRIYQAFYRNAVSFCTPATSNRTNGVAVAWQP